MKIYELLKRMISTENYEKEDMISKLNVFYAVNQLTKEQYLELMGLVNPIEQPQVIPEIAS